MGGRHYMLVTLYKQNEQYQNRITDDVVKGVCLDLDLSRLAFNFRFPTEVNVTLQELAALKKSTELKDNFRYLALKDNGYYIAGEVNTESLSKKSTSVLNRTMLTFDIDDAVVDVWEVFKRVYKGTECLMHTTISHQPEKPRYRILAPFDKPLNKEEFTLVSKYVAHTVGEGNLDPKTHDFGRVMFMPAKCLDGEYKHEYVPGKPLDTNTLLEKAKEVLGSGEGKREPKEKKSAPLIVELFNQEYPISTVISTWLSDTYTPCGVGRYKYKDSSSTGGARIYDEDTKFYSDHAKDPIGCKTLDAFNLLKEVKFDGSYKETAKFCSTLPSIATKLQKTRQESLDKSKVFEGTSTAPTKAESWKDSLMRSRNGALQCNMFNVASILNNDEALTGAFRYNQLTHMVEVTRNLGETIGGSSYRVGRPLEDADITDIRIYLEVCETPIQVAKTSVQDVIVAQARACGYNPVLNYLDSVKGKWDGIKRVDTIFIDYLGAEDNEINRAIARKVLSAAVWRVKVAGIKWDGIPTIYGQQGNGKSTFIQKLYKSSQYDDDCKNWVNDTPIDLNKMKEAIESTKMFWGIELAELANTTLSTYSNESMKAFISMNKPTIRVPYDRYPTTFERMSIFWGTTNQWTYISDQTGGRRFLPIDTKLLNAQERMNQLIKINAMPVDQIWAEVLEIYQDEKLYFTAEQEDTLDKLRRSHTEETTFSSAIEMFVNSKVPATWVSMTPLERQTYYHNGGNPTQDVITREEVCIPEITFEALGRNLAEMKRKDVRQIEQSLLALGFQVDAYNKASKYGLTRYYRRRK